MYSPQQNLKQKMVKRVYPKVNFFNSLLLIWKGGSNDLQSKEKV